MYFHFDIFYFICTHAQKKWNTERREVQCGDGKIERLYVRLDPQSSYPRKTAYEGR